MESVHLFACDLVGAFCEMQAERRFGPRRYRGWCHAKRVCVRYRHDADRKILVEIGLPAIVMHNVGHTSKQVFPGSDQQRFAARNGMLLGDVDAMAGLDVMRPAIGIVVGWVAKTAVMIPMQVVVRVDQPRANVGVGQIELKVEVALSLDDPPALDRNRLVARRNEQTHSILTQEGERQHDRQSDMLLVQCQAPSFLVERQDPGPDVSFFDRD